MSRIALTGPATFHAKTTGSDVSGDGTDANPMRNPQAVWDMLFADYDLRGFPVTVQLETATDGSHNFYEGLRMSGRLVGQGGAQPPLQVNPGRPPYLIGKHAPVTLRGDPAHKLGAFLYPPQDSGCPGVSLADCASLAVEGVTIDTYRAKADCIAVFDNAFLDFRGDVRFGAAGPWSNHISVSDATFLLNGNYEISGAGFYHLNLGGCGTVLVNNNGDPALHYTVTLLGQAFQQAFVLVDKGIFYAMALQFVGLVQSGLTAWVIRNGVIETASGANPNYFPGTVAPLLASGGQYL